MASASPSRCTLHSTLPGAWRVTCVQSLRRFPCSQASSWVCKGRCPQEIRRKEQSEVRIFIPMTFSLQVSWVGYVPQAKAITSFERVDSKFQPPLFPLPVRMVTTLLLPPPPPAPLHSVPCTSLHPLLSQLLLCKGTPLNSPVLSVPIYSGC